MVDDQRLMVGGGIRWFDVVGGKENQDEGYLSAGGSGYIPFAPFPNFPIGNGVTVRRVRGVTGDYSSGGAWKAVSDTQRMAEVADPKYVDTHNSRVRRA